MDERINALILFLDAPQLSESFFNYREIIIIVKLIPGLAVETPLSLMTTFYLTFRFHTS